MKISCSLSKFDLFFVVLETPSASPAKKSPTQFVDGNPVVPPKPGKPATPQATPKAPVILFFLSLSAIQSILHLS